MSSFTNKFQPRMRNILEEKGLTQKQVAKAIGKDPRSFGHYATGTTKPDIETLYDIASELRVSSDYLLGLSDNNSSGEFHEVKKSSNLLMPVYRINKEFLHNTIYTFYNNHRCEKVMGIYIDTSEYEPTFRKGTSLDVNCDISKITEEGYYVFEQDHRYIIRKAFPVDFSDKIKAVSLKGEEISIDSDQKVIGKVSGTRQDFG